MNQSMWRIKGENVSTCNCDWGCPCQFNARPTHGFCEAFVGIRINEGHYGDVNLNGVLFATAGKWPGALHEGNGTMQLVIDANTSPEQRSALLEIASGKNGGTFFEIISAVCPNVLQPVFARIHFETDRESRKASVWAEGVGQCLVEPIRNPVTGEEHRARINLPAGFEFQVAEVANAVKISVTAPEVLRMEHNGCHAHLSEIDWHN